MRIQISARVDHDLASGAVSAPHIWPDRFRAANDNARAFRQYRELFAAERSDNANLCRLALHSFLFSFVFNAVLILPV